MLGSKKMAFRTVHEQERLGNGKERPDIEQERLDSEQERLEIDGRSWTVSR